LGRLMQVAAGHDPADRAIDLLYRYVSIPMHAFLRSNRRTTYSHPGERTGPGGVLPATILTSSMEEELLQRPHHRLNRRVDADARHVDQGVGAGFPIDVGPDMLRDNYPSPRWATAITEVSPGMRDSARRTTRVSSPSHAAIALDRCPSGLDEGSFVTTIVPVQRAPLMLTCRKPP
jgi:hypothetical protein